MGVVMIYNPITEQMEPAAAVISYGLASEDEIEAGVADDKIVTPKGLAGALALKADAADVMNAPESSVTKTSRSLTG